MSLELLHLSDLADLQQKVVRPCKFKQESKHQSPCCGNNRNRYTSVTEAAQFRLFSFPTV